MHGLSCSQAAALFLIRNSGYGISVAGICKKKKGPP
jgi:hypothetical protein